jgi:hypothetical protein
MEEKIVVTLDIDWDLLREQRNLLIAMPKRSKLEDKLVDGILSVIRTIQEQAVEENGVPEEVVFGNNKE